MDEAFAEMQDMRKIVDDVGSVCIWSVRQAVSVCFFEHDALCMMTLSNSREDSATAPTNDHPALQQKCNVGVVKEQMSVTSRIRIFTYPAWFLEC